MVRKSAFISIALHLAILLWVLVVFPSGRALDACHLKLPGELRPQSNAVGNWPPTLTA